jgi:hypothetical protein
MKVFKFFSDDLFYAYSGLTEELAKDQLFENFGEMQIDKVEEIPESEWDEQIISMWEDNDLESEPYQVSIREQLFGEDSTLIFTNDIAGF